MDELFHIFSGFDYISRVHRAFFSSCFSLDAQIRSCLPRERARIIRFLSLSAFDILSCTIDFSNFNVQQLLVSDTWQIHLRIGAGRDRSVSVIKNSHNTVHVVSRAHRTQRTIYNGDSRENCAHHRRSQWYRLLHGSRITSRRSEGNLAKSHMK